MSSLVNVNLTNDSTVDDVYNEMIMIFPPDVCATIRGETIIVIVTQYLFLQQFQETFICTATASSTVFLA